MASAKQNVERKLLMRINRRLPAVSQARFDELVVRRQDEILTMAEHEELLRLIEQIEHMDVIRIKALAQLTQLRGITLDELIEQLNIRAAECD